MHHPPPIERAAFASALLPNEDHLLHERIRDRRYVPLQTNSLHRLLVLKAKGLDVEKVGRVFGSFFFAAGIVAAAAGITLGSFFSWTCVPLLGVGIIGLFVGSLFLGRHYYKDPEALSRFRRQCQNLSFTEICSLHTLQKALLFMTPLEMRHKLAQEWRSITSIEQFYKANYSLETFVRYGILLSSEMVEFKNATQSFEETYKIWKTQHRLITYQHRADEEHAWWNKQRADRQAMRDFQTSFAHNALQALNASASPLSRSQSLRMPKPGMRSQLKTASLRELGNAVLQPFVEQKRSVLIKTQSENRTAYQNVQQQIENERRRHIERIHEELNAYFAPYESGFCDYLHEFLHSGVDFQIRDYLIPHE